MRPFRRPVIAPLALGVGLAAACEQRDPSSPTAPGGSARGIETIVDVPIDISSTAGHTGTWNYAGQSFTIPAGTSLTNLRFNWYTREQGAIAFGALYLLEAEFLGRPGELSATTPGFIARSQSTAADAYTFAPDVRITGGPTGKHYWVYTDTMGSFGHSFDVDVYRGGDLYLTGYHANPFRKSQASGRMVNGVFVPAPANVSVDANFRLQGQPQ